MAAKCSGATGGLFFPGVVDVLFLAACAVVVVVGVEDAVATGVVAVADVEMVGSAIPVDVAVGTVDIALLEMFRLWLLMLLFL